jgi:spore coat protein CotH
VTVVSTLTLTQSLDGLFNPDALYRLDLLVGGGNWETLKAKFRDNDYYRADLRWNGLTVREVGIRSRGLGSRSHDKPGLRVDFDRYVRDQTFLGLSSLVLDNLATDSTGIRERVAMRFYERLGLPVPREAHLRLYVNNQYAGLYAVVESIDKAFLRRVFGKNASGVENDGYLFEYEWETVWLLTRPDRGLDGYRALFDPVTHERASTKELFAPLDDMVRTINDTPDDRFQSAVSQYLDLPLFMRQMAAQTFVAQWDGFLGYAGVNNFYLYRFENSPRSQLILWDEDHAFRMLDHPVLEGHDANALMRRVMKVPELRALYFDSLLAAAASATEPVTSGGTGWLEQEIRQQRRRIAESMREDHFKPYTMEEFETAMATLLEFVKFRPRFVRCEVARLTGRQTESGC